MQFNKDELSLLESAFEKALDDCRYDISDKTQFINELDKLDAIKYQQYNNASLSEDIAFWQSRIKKQEAKMLQLQALYKKITDNDYVYIPF